MKKEEKTHSNLFSNKDRFWMAILLLNFKNQTFKVADFSKLSGLSYGFISKFGQLLKEAGFLEKERHIQLKNPGYLLDTLRHLYFFEANKLVSYYSKETPEELIKKISKADKAYALTRMCGASLIAPFVRYQSFDCYISSEEDLSYWKEFLDLTDVEFTGNVNLWVPQNDRIMGQLQTKKGCDVVNNIQLYLDLYKYPARGREQAEHLREKVIQI